MFTSFIKRLHVGKVGVLHEVELVDGVRCQVHRVWRQGLVGCQLRVNQKSGGKSEGSAGLGRLSDEAAGLRGLEDGGRSPVRTVNPVLWKKWDIGQHFILYCKSWEILKVRKLSGLNVTINRVVTAITNFMKWILLLEKVKLRNLCSLFFEIQKTY